jgi:hypothetical protein
MIGSEESDPPTPVHHIQFEGLDVASASQLG